MCARLRSQRNPQDATCGDACLRSARLHGPPRFALSSMGPGELPPGVERLNSGICTRELGDGGILLTESNTHFILLKTRYIDRWTIFLAIISPFVHMLLSSAAI